MRHGSDTRVLKPVGAAFATIVPVESALLQVPWTTIAVAADVLLILVVILSVTFGRRALKRYAVRAEKAEEAERRAREEAALKEATRALGVLTDSQGVVQLATESAVKLTRAFGAYVEQIERPGSGGMVEVVAVAGEGVPRIGLRVPYPGSLTEGVIESRRPEIITEVGVIGDSMAPYLKESCRHCTGLVVPLVSASQILGALVLLRSPEQETFADHEVDVVRALGDSASAALRRVLLVEELGREHERADLERRRLQAVLDALPVGVFIANAQGRITMINPAVRDIWGKDVPLTESVAQFGEYKGWWPATGRRLETHEWALARALEKGEATTAEEIEIETTDGRRKAILNYAIPIRDQEGAIAGAVTVNVDITERRTAEERQRLLAEVGRIVASTLEPDETLRGVARLVVPDIADACAIYATDGGAIEVIEVAAEEPETTVHGSGMHRAAPPDAGPPAGVARVIRTGEPELQPVASAAALREALGDEASDRILEALSVRSVMVVPMVARTRTLGALVLVTSESGRTYGRDDLDLAEEVARRAALALENARLFEQARQARGEAERRAREEEALRRAAAAVGATFTIEEVVREIAHSALTATNAYGAVVERITLEEDEVVVVASAGERQMPIGSRMAYAGSLAQWVIERQTSESIATLADEAGRVSPDLLQSCPDCSALAVPLIDAGTAIGALILLREPGKWGFRPDEIERARAFGDLAALAFRKVHLLDDSERRRKELVEVMESRSRLMRGFSHDVKNPLGAADGLLQLLDEGIMGELSEKQREGVGRARRTIGDALKLIDDLLEMARTEAGELTIEWKPVDVREVAWEMGEEYRSGAEAKGLSMELRLPETLPVITTDADRIRQILGNILSNAVKYTRRGGITVSAELRTDGGAPGSGRWVAVHVSDTGPGIPVEQRDRLFKEYSRLDESGETRGAGIGLAISRRIARALGGDLTVESEVGRGSTFTLWLPHA